MVATAPCPTDRPPAVDGYSGKVDRGAVARLLLAHYDSNARSLPWRARPGAPAPDPYRVWLSEVMLQQTTVAAVIPRFARFLARWPTLAALAAADEGEVMAEWAGLGYYSRARNLLATAHIVAADHGGHLPDSEEALRSLPGMGAYTAAAVAAIAFGRRAVVVDANVERVVARLFAVAEPLPAARRAIRAAASTITPAERAGDFAQAMMDLGAGICTSRNPDCTACPIRRCCAAHAQGTAAELPVKAARKARPERHGRAFWVADAGEVLLVTRPRSGMLAGMAALPDDGWRARADGTGMPPPPLHRVLASGEWKVAERVLRHGFTHFELTLDLALYAGPLTGSARTALAGYGRFVPLEKLAAAGLPTVFARAAHAALALSGS